MIRRFLWKIISLVYKYIVKPIAFLQTPDKAHAKMIGLVNTIGRFALVRWLIRLVFKTSLDKRLVQSYHGVEFKSPVGLSAGLDKNGEILPVIASLGFGFGEVGSVTARPYAGNPRPWFYRLPKSRSLVVYVGLGNYGSSAVIKRLSQYKADITKDFPVILSVAKTNSRQVVSVQDGIDDYVTTVRRAKNKKFIQLIELNISCPNTYGGEPFTSVERLERLLSAIDKVGLTQPVFIKMPSDLTWDKSKELLDVIVNHKVVGVTIANLAKDRTKIKLQDDLPDTVRGNLSGKPTQAINDELIRRTYLAYGDRLTIIGVGGIFSADDAYRKIRLGASLVELITGLIFCGPQLMSEINDGLVARLTRDGFSHISQAIGVDASGEYKNTITTT